MIVDTVYADVLFRDWRIDAEFHLAEGVKARRRIDTIRDYGIELANLGGPDGLANVSQPGRFKRVYAETLEGAVPYLRPYDVFDYLPIAADHISEAGTKNLAVLRLEEGTIVVPASGRNLGPAVAIDSHLAKFALSHDAVRIKPHKASDLPYILTFINSSSGQAILRSGITGSVIDHIAVRDLTQLQIPLLETEQRASITALTSASIRLRGQARSTIARLIERLQGEQSPATTSKPREGWTIQAAYVFDRIDAAPYLPQAAQARLDLDNAGGDFLTSVASVEKPASRYTAYHVSAQYGRPFLTGGQLRQSKIIAPKYMADRVFVDPERYALSKGDVIFAADGRANEGLGVPVMVTSDRHGWLASEHVMRLRGFKVSPGQLYLAMCSPNVQLQLQALPRGSVVDTLYVDDMPSVVLPKVPASWGAMVQDAWEKFALADMIERRSVSLFEAALRQGGRGFSDVLLNMQEAAAVLDRDVAYVRRLVDRGSVYPVGEAGEDDYFLLLGDLLAASDRTEEPSGSDSWAMVYGRVKTIESDAFLGEVADSLGGAGDLVRFPMEILRPGDADHLGEGDYFVFRARSVPSGDGSMVESWSIRILPHPVLTEDQISESFRWADSFLKKYVSGSVAINGD